MARAVNLTNFRVAQTIGHDAQGLWRATVIVKGAWTWDDAGAVTPAVAGPLLDSGTSWRAIPVPASFGRRRLVRQSRRSMCCLRARSSSPCRSRRSTSLCRSERA